ncbi:MAG: anthranilate synthase component II [Actinomycetota bacterium]
MRVLLIDNYDSFVYNLAQYIGALGADPVVLRNDVSLEEMEEVGASAVVISPGPGRPEDAGYSVDAVRRFGHKVPVLGVCLGHQAIGVAFGGKVVRADRVMHGKTSEVFHTSAGIFAGLPNPFDATRYHSLVVDAGSLPEDLELTAWTSDGTVMGMRHRSLAVEGVQFHPEAVMTSGGMQMIENLLAGVG